MKILFALSHVPGWYINLEILKRAINRTFAELTEGEVGQESDAGTIVRQPGTGEIIFRILEISYEDLENQGFRVKPLLTHDLFAS